MHPLLLTLTLTLISADGPPKAEPLWAKAAPGALGDKDADVPTLTPFLPAADKASGAAVVICPGGGYGGLAISYEGMDVGELDGQTRRRGLRAEIPRRTL